MSNTATTQPNSPPARLEHAIQLAKSGKKSEARDILRQVVALQPVNQAAWLWLSAVALDKPEAETALTQARTINPSHSAIPRAEQWLAQRFSNQSQTRATPVRVSPQTPPPKARRPQPTSHKFFNSLGIGLVLVAIVAGLVVLLLGIFWEANATAQVREAPDTIVHLSPPVSPPTTPSDLDIAWQNQDWPQAITLLETQLLQQPNDPDIQAKLGQAHLQAGLVLRHQDQLEAAQVEFEEALKLNPQSTQAQQELELVSYYLAGKRHYQNGAWTKAIIALEAVYREESTYNDIKDLLFSAYYNQGLALHAAEDLSGAHEALTAAIALRPDLAEPRLHLAQLDYAMAPENPPEIPVNTVSVEDRIVVVGIAEQRMHVFEGDNKIYDFIVSTGEPGRDTAIGEFEIQNKIDVAYASTWNLDMPFWMGIYWAGPLQNGIHSLPTVKHTGQTLWDGYLGQRVSYGCVILGHDDASTLYNWAEVGTKVKIVPSLATWDPASE